MVGFYRILQPLGSGGFGETFLAEDTQFPGNPHCVVKKLKPQLDNPHIWPDACRLFQREADILSKLGTHDQIPRLLAHFEEAEHFFLVQELIDGADLSRELIVGQQCSEYYAVTLLDSILEVLEFVHQQGVIHRDIKPSNLIRRRHDGKIVLIDFGAVKAVGLQTTVAHGNTAQTISICTPGYTPNEQYSGQPKLSSDVFAVGMVGIQALTGKLPSELDKDSQSGEVLWTHHTTVSPHVATIINKMVLYDFRHRYQNATEARAALQHLLATQPISVPTPSSPAVPSTGSGINLPSNVPDAQLLSAKGQTSTMKPKLPIRTFFAALFIGLLGGAAGAVYVTARFFPTAFAPTVVTAPPDPSSTTVEGGPGEDFTAESPGKNVEEAEGAVTTPETISAANAPVVVDYTPLKESLTAGQWKNADQLTRDLLLSITGRSGSTLRVEDVEQIPCQDLQTINQYWEQASQGRFGFTAQAKVWQTLVGKFTENTNVKRNNSDSALTEFVQRTRWFYLQFSVVRPYDYGQLVFALNAPPGHLPVKAFLPVDTPNDSTTLKGAVVLIPTLAQRVSFCEKEATPPSISDAPNASN
ncbi:serine/threonine-protein kinase [Acaryochloris sp. IP29b_bin.148]|uniref:serine/threonine-protein kinase n=1 Tax=Acaryochloris sp. IP29b_bin.148 TaxID=2969218 RepID=UPI002601A8B5|nr:serine/threonine-protein kinase [Acaryochloris sp. IP29b_bin.148]